MREFLPSCFVPVFRQQASFTESLDRSACVHPRSQLRLSVHRSSITFQKKAPTSDNNSQSNNRALYGGGHGHATAQRARGSMSGPEPEPELQGGGSCSGGGSAAAGAGAGAGAAAATPSSFRVGDRVCSEGARATVRYVGPVSGQDPRKVRAHAPPPPLSRAPPPPSPPLPPPRQPWVRPACRRLPQPRRHVRLQASPAVRPRCPPRLPLPSGVVRRGVG
jgi:hypothetical protein